jgi:zinc protease
MFRPRLQMSALLSLALCAAQPVFAESIGSIQAPVKSELDTMKESASKPPTIPYEKFKLKNGLEVILSEDHRLPLVAVNLWYHVGPANEVAGRTGFAHLFEHMMFEGSKHVGAKAHFKYLEGAGATSMNGTTDFDRTNYFETVPSNQLELALWLESDRMGYLYDTLDAEKLANQRDVVRNERRQSIENAPYGLVEEAQFHELFPKGHPYYASVMGSHADIEAARLNDLRAFFKQYYTPNNASIAVVGDINKEQAKALVEKYFGSIPEGPAVPEISVKTPPITSRKEVTVMDQVQLPRLYMSWLTPTIFKPGDAEGDLASHILGGGKSSRLYKKLVYDRQIAQDVSVGNQNLLLGSVFSIQVTAKPGVKLEDLEKAVNEEVAAFRKNGPTASELEGAKNTIEMHIISGLESFGGFGGVANRLNMYNYFLKDPGYLPQDLERYENATLDGVKQFADSYLTDNSCVVVKGVPGKKVIEDVPRSAADKEADKELEKADKEAAEKAKSNEAVAAADAWRAQQPKAAMASKLVLPIPVSFKIANGLTVYLVERHTLPVVAATLTSLGGSTSNPVEKPGLSWFTADMLDEGTTTRSTLQLADDLDHLGTSLHTSSTQDAAWATMHCLTKTAQPAFDMLADVVLHPAFETKEVERVRNELVTSLQQDKDQPPKIARRVLYRELYGADNPLGYDERGTLQSAKAMSREDMVKFWKDNYVPGSSALVIAGDLTQDQARSLAEKYFGDWKGSAVRPQLKETKNPDSRTIYLVNKDAAPQTALNAGLLGLSRSNPDYVPALLLNTAFGGMFSSRLNMNLREKHGYTYGAHSGFAFLRNPGPFSVSTSVRSDVTAPAVSEMFKELSALQTKPVSAEELTMSKDNVALSLPGMFETSPSVAHSTSNLFIYDLPLDYYLRLPEKINATTSADIARVAQKYLKPERMVVAAVGDKAKIEAELKALNLGPIKELDFECNPVLP